MSLSTDQIKELLAAGVSADKIAEMVAASSTTQNVTKEGLRNKLSKAANPNEYGLSLGHPEKDDSWKTSGGKFDGDYEITIKSIGFESKKRMEICRTVFTVDKSTNDLVRAGSEREHPIFLTTEAAESECKGLLQKMFEAKGGVGDWNDDEVFYDAATGEKNSCAGMKFALSVLTQPQKNKPEKAFTHYRYSPLGEASASATTTTTTGTSEPLLCPDVPKVWPLTTKWIHESDAQYAARKALAGAC